MSGAPTANAPRGANALGCGTEGAWACFAAAQIADATADAVATAMPLAGKSVEATAAMSAAAVEASSSYPQALVSAC